MYSSGIRLSTIFLNINLDVDFPSRILYFQFLCTQMSYNKRIVDRFCPSEYSGSRSLNSENDVQE
jgi:hypothetical protein